MENRRQARKSVTLSFQYTREDDTGKSKLKEATVVDLNEQGIRFEAMEKLPVGTRLTLNFDDARPPEKTLTFASQGIVVWSIRPDPEESFYRIGLKYI